MSTINKPGLRERNKAEKWERILSAARHLFAQNGFDATTGRQISERAEVGTGTLFTYVEDKRELLLWVFAKDVTEILDRPLPGIGSPIDRWIEFLGPFLDLYSRDQNLAASYVQELLFRTNKPDQLVVLHSRLLDGLEEIASDAQSKDLLRSDLDSGEVALLVAGQYGQLIQLWLGAGLVSSDLVPDLLKRGLTLLVEGIGE